MKTFNSQELFELIETFKTEEDCKQYLFDLKFKPECKCSKCNNIDFYKGIKPYTKVCKKCKHVESGTSNTMFHKVKFGLRKAFYIIYDITTSNGISAKKLASKYKIQYNTAWLFTKKVRTAMQSSEQYPMVERVYVDEFVIGGFEKGAVGRKNKSKKIKAIIAVETTNKNKTKRVYAMQIKDYSAAELRKIFEKHISTSAKVKTDEWRGYSPLKKEYTIKQDKRIKNNNPSNTQIQKIKSWLRHVHGHVSKHHIETYFNEYSFRINRSQWKDSIFHKCVERMINSEKKTKLQLSATKKVMTRKDYVERVKIYIGMNAEFKVVAGKIRLVA